MAYERIASASFPVQIQNDRFNRTLRFQELARQKKAEAILCVRKVFLKVVFLGLQDLFSWLIFPKRFLSVSFCISALSRSAPIFPSFPFSPLHLAVFFPSYFLSESYGINMIFLLSL